MGQVPQGFKILLVGNGRLAASLRVALQNSGAHIREWTRVSSVASSSVPSLADTIEEFDPSHIYLAVSDSAIEELALQNQKYFRARTVVHFAGSRPSLHGVHAAHPLSTFSSRETPVVAEDFARIPFVLDRGGPPFSELFPTLHNPSFEIDADDRRYYHAHCSLSGNFTVLLWEAVTQRFQSKLGLPKDALSIYREQIFKNLALAKSESVLTGPLVRGDRRTIDAHLASLAEYKESALTEIYRSFIHLYQENVV